MKGRRYEGAQVNVEGNSNDLNEESMSKRTAMSQILGGFIALVILIVLLVVPVPADAKDKHPVIERFRANAMDVDSGRASLVEIGVFGWNTDADRQDLIKTFQESGNPAIYKWMSRRDEMAFGAEFGHNKKTGQLQIEILSMQPTQLKDVRTEKVKHKDKK